MGFVFQPWQLVLVALAGWVNNWQQQEIDYLRTENRILREKLGKKRILLNNDQRRRLAVVAKAIGRQRLQQVATLFTADTILRWHRQLVAEKWTFAAKSKVGRPKISEEITELVLRMARENSHWGYDRIQGAIKNLGFRISDQAVGNILREHGIPPAPDRKRSTQWSTFLAAHLEVMAAIDFTTVEVWTTRGLTTIYLLFVMKLKTREIHFVGSTVNPNENWMKQAARELTNCDDGFLRGSHILLMDRDTKFCDSFRRILSDEGIRSLQLPPRSPNMNAHIERFMRSIKEECLDRMIFFGERSLCRAIRTWLTHFHCERNHQGLGNRIISPEAESSSATGVIKCRERLGGMIRYYHRAAA